MKKLELLQAAAIRKVDFDDNALRWNATRIAVTAFRSNMERAARMLEVPSYAALSAEFHRIAIEHVCGHIPTTADLPLIRANGNAIQRKFADLMNGDRDSLVNAMVHLTKNLDAFVENTPAVRPIFSSFLGSVLVQAWTTFECLIRQVIQQSILQHPQCFPFLDIAQREKFTGGTFQKLDTIRSSYQAAFRKASRVCNPINEQCVAALYYARNLLVHSSGIVDNQFRERCSRNGLTEWAELPVGSTLEITGCTIESHVNANQRCGYNLLRAVDDWLTEQNPDAPR